MSLPSWRCCRCFTRGAEEFMKDQNLSDPWIFTVFSVCFLSFCSTLFLNELLYLFLCIKFWNFHSYFFPNWFVLNEQQYVWIDKQAYHISYSDNYCLSNWWWQEYCSYSRVHGVRSRVHPELAASVAITESSHTCDQCGGEAGVPREATRHSKHEDPTQLTGGSNLESASCSVATRTERNNECERKRSCFPSFICDVFSFNPP